MFMVAWITELGNTLVIVMTTQTNGTTVIRIKPALPFFKIVQSYHSPPRVPLFGPEFDVTFWLDFAVCAVCKSLLLGRFVLFD